MNEQTLKSLYSTLQARRPELGDAALAHRLGAELRVEAEQLSAGLARSRGGRRSRGPLLGWALAASVALVAVFASRQLGQDPGGALPRAGHDTADMLAEGSAPAQTLFSGSFERGEQRGIPTDSDVIFDNDFGG